MRPNKLRELLKSNKPTLSTHIHTTWPSVVEAIGHTGLYDYVEFVGEYGPFDLHDLDNLARAGDIYNMSMQLKVDQEPRGFLAQRAIGSGFHSILFADCRSAADVQECVRIVRAGDPGGQRNLRRGHPSVHLHGLWRHQGVRPGPARHRRGHHDREAGDGRHARGSPLRQRCRHACSGEAPTTRWASDGPASATPRSYEW